jgi:hypothetical protein
MQPIDGQPWWQWQGSIRRWSMFRQQHTQRECMASITRQTPAQLPRFIASGRRQSDTEGEVRSFSQL